MDRRTFVAGLPALSLAEHDRRGIAHEWLAGR